MSQNYHRRIRVLVADDDQQVLECYQSAFSSASAVDVLATLNELAAELFDEQEETLDRPEFDVTVCDQGEDAVALVEAACSADDPFHVVILDIRMPPGIDGVEAGSRIRAIDSEAEIIFVSGFSDVPIEELQRRVPPKTQLHYFNKPISFTQLANDVATMVGIA